MSSPETKSVADDPFGKVAVVGMSGRFPGAADVRAFWRNLRGGVESVTFFTPEELLAAGVDEALISDPNYVPAAARLEHPELFDAAFFNINPREAELTDPQQRILLEVAWAALEDAGIDPGRTAGAIGVFAGTGRNHYLKENLLARPDILATMGAVAETVGNEKDFVAARLAYKLGLRGPCVSVQTACSTSLVAAHLAAQSLINGECDVCLAGGASVTGLRKEGYLYVEGGIFSPDGHLRAFDAKAAGQIGGNGAAMVVLKRLEDALADRDTIHAVILGSAVNNDGSQKVSFTAPGVEGQAQVIVEALALADVEPDSIGYVECHGTGTLLGDPIEVRALTQAYRSETERKGFCGLGSLKTNVGHLDAAAGAAGLIKAALALEHKELPPSLHFEHPNPALDLAESPFYVQKELGPWPGDGPRRCGVSSFGMGGTNAHAILEEAPAPAPRPVASGPRLLCLSARVPEALQEVGTRLADRLAGEDAPALVDVASTLALGRAFFEQRRAIVIREGEDPSEPLRAGRRVLDFKRRALESGASVAFLFPGQGSQYPGMARALYEHEDTVRQWIDRGADDLRADLGCDLRELLFPPAGGEAEAALQLARTRFTQPALFVVEYAIAQHLIALGLRPGAMIGHSIGEYVAATLAGVFRYGDALGLVAARGRRIDELPAGGCMLAVHATEEDARAGVRELGEELDVAAVNAPGMIVLSGAAEVIARVQESFAEQGVSSRKLETSHAFHSALMEPMLAAFEADVAAVERKAPEIPIVSTRTGTWLTDEQACDPAYWSAHVREPVRFAQGVVCLLEDEGRVLIEVGPGTTLTTLARASGSAKGRVCVATTPHPRAEEDGRAVLLGAVGAAWTAGVDVPLEKLFEEDEARQVPLPTYPFQRQRFWVEPGAAPAQPQFLGKHADVGRWLYVPSWSRTAPSPRRTSAGSWCLVGDGSPGVEQLAEALRAAGEEVTLGEPATWRPDPDRVPGVIVFATAAKTAGEALEEAFFAPLDAAQACASMEGVQDARFVVVTRGAQAVLGDEIEWPERAAAAGVAKAVDAEFAGWLGAWIDHAPAGLDVHGLVRLVLGEDLPRTVALRGRHAWIAGPTPLSATCDPGVAALPRPGSCVLVTGGLGGIGLSLAEELAGIGDMRLVLIGRSALPDPGTWDAQLEALPEDDSVAQKIRAARGLEAAGAEVLCLSADVADAAQLAAAVEAARARFGRIDGVIHSAGVPAGGLLSLKKRGDAQAVLAAKVEGTRALAALFEDAPPEIFVLCSSLATSLSGVGQVDYFAANACLDAFAHFARAKGIPAVAIDWDAWQEVGMAVNTVVPQALRQGREESLRLGIKPSEGREVLRRALSLDVAQVLVSTRDLDARILEAADAPDLGGEGQAAPISDRHPRPNLQTPWVAPETATEKAVAELWAELLGLDKVGRDDAFFELGGNSLLLMQVSARLRTDFDVKLAVGALFDTPDVASLAERIDTLRLVREVGSSPVASLDRASGNDGRDDGGDDDGGETEEFRL